MKAMSRLCIAMALALAAPLALAQGALDGSKYIGDIGDVGKSAEVKDAVFIFAGGMFNSSECEKYGFDKGTYTATKDGAVIRFEARTVSSEYGTNYWRGTVKGGEVEGLLTWHRKPSLFRPNPEPVERWFKAKLM